MAQTRRSLADTEHPCRCLGANEIGVGGISDVSRAKGNNRSVDCRMDSGHLYGSGTSGGGARNGKGRNIVSRDTKAHTRTGARE